MFFLLLLIENVESNQILCTKWNLNKEMKADFCEVSFISFDRLLWTIRRCRVKKALIELQGKAYLL